MASHTEPAKPAPKAKAMPVFGNIFDVKREGLLQFLMRGWRTHGDVFRVHMGHPIVVVAHPDGVERILASHKDRYVKGATYDGVRRIIGDGVLALEGDAWKTRRRLLQPHFHRKNLEELSDIMVREGIAFFDAWQARLPDGGLVDMHDEMVTLTLDVVVGALFGDGLSEAADVPHEALAHALEAVSDQGNGIVLPAWIPTPGNRKLKRTIADVERAVYAVIDHVRAAGKNAAPSRSTLLGMLLDSVDADTGEPLSDKEIRDEVFTLFIAGHETTALTLAWMFTLLDGQDEVVAKMRDEVDTVLGGRAPTFADVPKLTYLRKVVDETLRLRGPVAMTARNVVEADNIMGYAVNAGDVVMPLFWALHRREEIWPDPERFDPERFDPENARGRDAWAYLPFSGGQRVCIGNTFSLTEAVLLIALIMQRMEFALETDKPITPDVLTTVRPSGPVRVRVHWRADGP